MSQDQDILAHLRKGGTLTALQALELYQCLRLASRINALKSIQDDEGNYLYPIQTEFITRNGKRVARYSLRAGVTGAINSRIIDGPGESFPVSDREATSPELFEREKPRYKQHYD